MVTETPHKPPLYKFIDSCFTPGIKHPVAFAQNMVFVLWLSISVIFGSLFLVLMTVPGVYGFFLFWILVGFGIYGLKVWDHKRQVRRLIRDARNT